MIMGVPYDAELEYLESTGTQYIDTGYIPSGTTETEITVMPTNQSYSCFMFGCRTGGTNNTYACLVNHSNRIGYAVVANGGFSYKSGYNEVNSIHTYKISSGVFYRDGVVVNNTYRGQSVSPKCSLALLSINTSNVFDTTQTFIGRFYSCTIKDNNLLVRDFIPVRVGQVGYMYDRVSKKLFSNQGTGSFILGPDVATPVIGLRRYPQIGGAA